MTHAKLTLPTPEELGLTPAEYGDLLHGVPPWAESEPVIEDVSTALHIVHAEGCTQEHDEWLTTWCGIAVEQSGQRHDHPATTERPLCPPCMDAVLTAAAICPICHQFAG